MMDSNEIGRMGELLASEYLEKLGWRIAARNYHAAKGEIDIIAWMNERVLVFVEVKTRGDNLYSAPADAVNSKKQQHVAKAAGYYMAQVKHEGAIRFDIISIILKNGKLRDLQHLEDAFFPGL